MLHGPVPPAVVHGFVVVNAPGPLSIVKLICVPFGAFTTPVPSFTLTCAVNVCAWPTRFTPFGVIWMFASTNVFTASSVFGAFPSVDTVNASHHRQRRRRMPGDLPGRVRRERDRALTRRVRIRASSRAGTPCGRMSRPVRVRQREVHMLTRSRHKTASPMSFDTVTVNVCGWPTSFVASGVISIFAPTQFFVALSPFA